MRVDPSRDRRSTLTPRPAAGRSLAALLLSGLMLVGVGLSSSTRAASEPEGKAAKTRTRAFRLLGQGVNAYRHGEFKKAVELLEQAAEVALNNFRTHFYLGLALNEDRRYTRAIEILQIAIDLDPQHLQSHVAIGDAYLKLGDLQEASASYFRALKIRPDYAGAFDGLARLAEARADTVKAIETYRKAIAFNKGYAPAYTHLGDLLLEEGRYEEAVALLEEAVSVRADYAPGLNRLSRAYGLLGLNTEAVATIQRAIELQPRNPLHKATLGELQLGQGFWSAAELSFLEALELDPSQIDAQLGLARLSRLQGDYVDAVDQIDAVLADDRLAGRRRLTVEKLRAEVEAEGQRIVALEAAVDDATASSGDYQALARIYAGRSMWAEAAELTSREQTSVDQRQRLAYLLFQSGRFRESHEVYAALRAETPSSELALNDGVTLALLGDDGGARQAFREALELDADNQRARLYLGNAQLRDGATDAAVDSYVTFLDANPRGEEAERVRRILAKLAPDRVQPPSPPAGAPDAKPDGQATEDGTATEDGQATEDGFEREDVR